MVTTGSSSSPSNRGDENMVEVVVHVSSDDKEDTTQWLSVLLQTKFWCPCKDHWEENCGEMSMFCLYCYEVVCPHCTHVEPGHRLLKIRRYAYRSFILIKDMHDLDLGINVHMIQTYIRNNQRGVHLRPVRRSPRFRPTQGAARCTTCFVCLRDKLNLFCSLACKENADISGDFSETEADRKHRQQIQATVEPSPERTVVLALAAPQPQPYASPVEDQRDTDMAEAEQDQGDTDMAEAEQSYEQGVVDVPKPPSPTPQQPEEPPAPVVDQHQLANNLVSLRRRPRKMAHPARAPFF